MRNKIIFAVLALGLSGRAYAVSQMEPYSPIPGFAPQSMKFDDRGGKGFAWTKILPCGVNRATVVVKFDDAHLNQDGFEVPIAKVWLHSSLPDSSLPGDSAQPNASEQWVAAVLQAPTDTWKLNGMVWLEKVTGSNSQGAGGYAPADLNQPERIDLAWTPDGAVTVSFNGEFTKRATSAKQFDKIGVGGSWANVEFTDFKVGYSGAPDPMCNTAAPATNQ